MLYPQFLDPTPAVVANRVENVGPRIQDSTQARNVHEWELR